MAWVVCRYNKYSQVAARAVRASLKEPERIKAEKRALVTLKKQTWDKGTPSESVSTTIGFAQELWNTVVDGLEEGTRPS